MFYLQYKKFYNKYKDRRLGITIDKKGRKKVDTEGVLKKNGRSYSFVAWKQYYDLQQKDRNEDI